MNNLLLLLLLVVLLGSKVKFHPGTGSAAALACNTLAMSINATRSRRQLLPVTIVTYLSRQRIMVQGAFC